ncbi:outer membrane beta-barrel protein [Stutzerimonas urumqiensis]|uniref:outer membrane beta-barrel protein n=1 Tax=Stutzerimonas urumqiensis TaxID=638269 RepID=UPI003DA4E843
MRITKFLTTTLVIGASTSAWAVDDPASINLAGFEFTPQLAVSESYDDNYRGMNENEQSSWVTGISPEFLLTAETRKAGYQLGYSLDHEIFHSDSEATNTDHHLFLKSVMEFTARHRLGWNLEHHRVEETSDTETITENDKYSSTIAGAAYRFGADRARNQLEFGTRFEARRYHNSGTINADEERDSLMINGIWYHRLGGRTRSLVELRQTEHDYKRRGSTRDATDTAVLVGASLDATAKLSGSVRVGAAKKDFDSDLRDDYSSPMWEANLTWKPRTYSIFTLDARRAFDEGDDGAATVENVSTQLGWRHEWTSRIATELDYRLADKEYEGIGRQDDRTSYGAAVVYSPDRWIDVTLGYRYTDNDSNFEQESYERNVYLLGFEMSL